MDILRRRYYQILGGKANPYTDKAAMTMCLAHPGYEEEILRYGLKYPSCVPILNQYPQLIDRYLPSLRGYTLPSAYQQVAWIEKLSTNPLGTYGFMTLITSPQSYGTQLEIEWGLNQDCLDNNLRGPELNCYRELYVDDGSATIYASNTYSIINGADGSIEAAYCDRSAHSGVRAITAISRDLDIHTTRIWVDMNGTTSDFIDDTPYCTVDGTPYIINETMVTDEDAYKYREGGGARIDEARRIAQPIGLWCGNRDYYGNHIYNCLQVGGDIHGSRQTFGRIYAVRIYNSSGVLTQNWIPCYRKATSSLVQWTGLYNTIGYSFRQANVQQNNTVSDSTTTQNNGYNYCGPNYITPGPVIPL